MALEELVIGIYPDWMDTHSWAEDSQNSYRLEQQSRRNQFVSFEIPLAEVVTIRQEMGPQFGSYQNLESLAACARRAFTPRAWMVIGLS